MADTPRKEAPRRGGGSGPLTEYLRQSSRPLPSLAFVLPLLVIYEVGVLVLGPQAVRNGADVWLRQFLDWSGFGQYFLLPALTIALLLAWHHLTRDRWRVSAAVVYVMFAECAILGLVLVGCGRLQAMAAQSLVDPGVPDEAQRAALALALPMGAAPAIGRIVGYMGAGVYEEMLFRLMLLPPVAACAWRIGAQRGLRIVMAVLLTSLLFSAAHYLGRYGEEFNTFSFAFRFLAGVFFAVLFVYRGFGIAAGTHALYDVFVSVG
ncbi:MAG: CPBP family intramembrane glutamic endopeptidase [Pirellulales bacterium]